MEETSEVLVMTAYDNPMGSAIEAMQAMVLATLMGTHGRLGCASVLQVLDPEVLRREVCERLLAMTLTQVYLRTGLEWLVRPRELNVPFPLMPRFAIVDLIKTETEGFVLKVSSSSVESNANNERLEWEVSVHFDEIGVVSGGPTHVEIPKSAMHLKTNAPKMQKSFNLSDEAVDLMVSPLWGVVYGDSGRDIQMHGGQWGLYSMNLLLDPAMPGVVMSSRLPMYVHNLEQGGETTGLYELQEEADAQGEE